MEDFTDERILLSELVYAWEFIPWWHRKAIALACLVNAEMTKFASMNKSSVGYVLFAAFIVSCTGSRVFGIRGNALLSLAFGGMLAATLMFSAFYLVWRYLK